MTKRSSILCFLRGLYEDDPLIANARVLELVRRNFPGSNAKPSAVYVWKLRLRQQGCKIPFQKTYEDK